MKGTELCGVELVTPIEEARMARKLVAIVALTLAMVMPAHAETVERYYVTGTGGGVGLGYTIGISSVDFDVPAGARYAKIVIDDAAFPRTYGMWSTAGSSDEYPADFFCRTATIELAPGTTYLNVAVQQAASTPVTGWPIPKTCRNAGASVGRVKVTFS